MLTIRESKLTKTAEEASEVAKEALKAMHFPGQIYEGKLVEERLRDELMDLHVCEAILTHLRIIRPITREDLFLHFQSKYGKIEKYTRISHELGALQEPWLPPPLLFGE